jgi:protein O-GlcNAc transferase
MNEKELLNLGVQLHHAGKLPEAAAQFQTCLALDPLSTRACEGLGNVLREMGRLHESLAAYQRGLSMRPADVQLLNGVGVTLGLMNQNAQAAVVFRQALEFEPDSAGTHHNLAIALLGLDQRTEALAHFRRALELNPLSPTTYRLLIRTLEGGGEHEQAEAVSRKAAELWPESAEFHRAWGADLCAIGNVEQAIAAYGRALQLDPNDFLTHNNLAAALFSKGEIEQAIIAFDRAVQLAPNLMSAASNRLYAMQSLSDMPPQQLRQELAAWDKRYAQPLRRSIRPHDNDPSPDRALRIGYVSPDFRNHVVARCLLPLLEQRDRQQFKVICYATVSQTDEMTRRIKEQSDEWRNIEGVADEQAAELVRTDQIDILVDLAVHTAGNRLLLFAHKPAPVQVTYLGYPGSTGLETIDYRLSDPYLDPPDADLSAYSEQTIRLPHSYWCYQPGGATPDVGPSQMTTSGHITFGCLCHFSKVSRATLQLWARVLIAVPRSHLLLYCPSDPQRHTVQEQLAHQGIAADRVEFVGFQSWEHYARTYHRIDVALDPFPRGGGITTCDALWMGVPVITLAGRTATARAGCSILSNVGIAELIAQTPQDYVNLAARAEKWTELRPTLRRRMAASPLMDAQGCARDLEAAYRQMWIQWIAQRRG